MREIELSENLEKFMQVNKMYHFEGESGVRNIETIAEAIGYRQGINEMLADNPGMQQAIVDWLLEQDVDTWNEKLMEDMGCDDEDEAQGWSDPGAPDDCDEREYPIGGYCDEEGPISED